MLICYLVTSELPCHCITMSCCRASALDKYDVMDGVQYVDTTEAHTFLWPLSPKPFNFGYRCFGVFRYSLTQGTPSRSLVRSSCYTLYIHGFNNYNFTLCHGFIEQ